MENANSFNFMGIQYTLNADATWTAVLQDGQSVTLTDTNKLIVDLREIRDQSNILLNKLIQINASLKDPHRHNRH